MSLLKEYRKERARIDAAAGRLAPPIQQGTTVNFLLRAALATVLAPILAPLLLVALVWIGLMDVLDKEPL